jgi:hypothetical protein
MPLRPSTKTFATLFSEISRVFGDESGVQLSQSDVARWGSAAQMEIVSSNKALKAKSTTPSVAGQAAYTFPGFNIQQIEALHYNNVLIQNVPFASAEEVIISADPNYVQQGTPQIWYEWDGEFTLWPAPDSVGVITLYYTEYPTDLTGDVAQLLSVPDKFYNAVVDYVLSKAYEMDEDYQSSQMAEQRFRAALESQMEDERLAQNMTYPIIQDVVSRSYYSG